MGGTFAQHMTEMKITREKMYNGMADRKMYAFSFYVKRDWCRKLVLPIIMVFMMTLMWFYDVMFIYFLKYSPKFIAFCTQLKYIFHPIVFIDA